MTPSDILTLDEVAALLKVHPRTVMRLAKSGGIPAIRVASLWRFRQDQITAWLDSQKPTPTEAPPPAEDAPLEILFQPAAMQLRMNATTREEALQELAALVDCPDPQALYRLLLEREKLFSTGLTHGVALPHPRQAVPGLDRSPLLAFGRSLNGISFGAPDGQATKLFFLVCAARDGEHLRTLAKLAHLCRDAAFCNDLFIQNAPEGVVRVVREHMARRAQEIS